MSSQPIDRSPDLKRLRDEGYNIAILDGYLVVRDIPYVNGQAKVCRGVWLAPLTAANDVAQPPGDHVAQWAGEYPCHANGRPITEMQNSVINVVVGGVAATFSFSAKPKPSDRYANFYDKVTAYVQRISGPAQELDPHVTAKTYPHIAEDEEESVFLYVDTASSRAEITAVAKKLKGKRVAIVGLGGTGGYTLDYVAKTHVEEIHLFDGDVFSQHNAFRAPGAASGDDLELKLPKVEYFRRQYSRMRKGIIAHQEYAGAASLDLLDKMDFVFLSMEASDAKRLVIERLVSKRIPFVDVGMGVYQKNDVLSGTLRVTAVSEDKHDHIADRVPFSDGGLKNEYDKNIQIAELNALNAALAVIRFKKHFGIYADQGGEHYSAYSIGRNDINNEEEK